MAENIQLSKQQLNQLSKHLLACVLPEIKKLLPDKNMRMPEVCAYTGLKETAIRNLIRAGKFPQLYKIKGINVSIFSEQEVRVWVRQTRKNKQLKKVV